MRVLINGLPLFGQRLANDLTYIAPNQQFHFFNTYYNRRDQLKFMMLSPFTDIFISMNGVTDESGSMNKVLKSKKPLVMQWMGTDISLALERAQNKTINRKYLEHATHFVDAPWMVKELESIGLNVVLAPFKWVESRQRVLPYGRMQVLTYIPESRMNFYGWQQVRKLASDFPNVVFLVFGTTFCTDDFPENISLQGWVSESDFRREMEKSAVFLRLTEHDGYSVSVMEALAAGCEVLATHPFEHCSLITPNSSLSEVFANKLKLVENRGMFPNQDHIRFADKNYKRENVLTSYLQKLEKLV
jgi:hypothetical protein